MKEVKHKLKTVICRLLLIRRPRSPGRSRLGLALVLLVVAGLFEDLLVTNVGLDQSPEARNNSICLLIKLEEETQRHT